MRHVIRNPDPEPIRPLIDLGENDPRNAEYRECRQVPAFELRERELALDHAQSAISPSGTPQLTHDPLLGDGRNSEIREVNVYDTLFIHESPTESRNKARQPL
ncbi:MAG TPA: hypothetical protein VEY93_10280 [Longimicrobium sp.]|nr:hypothetical protein [Longimicrobium sp.]